MNCSIYSSSFRIDDILKNSTLPSTSFWSSFAAQLLSISTTNNRSPEKHPHSPTRKLQQDDSSILNQNISQQSLSSSSINDKIQYQHMDRKDCLSSLISHHQSVLQPYCYIQSNQTRTSSCRKGGQIRFSIKQSLELEKQFEISQYLSPIERQQIAEALQLSDRQIKTWFQNRRAKHRRSATIMTKKDIDKSCSSLQQTDDDIDNEEHTTSSNSN